MKFELWCFRITVKLARKGRNVVQTQMADRKCTFGGSFCTGWPYSPLPNECVRRIPTGHLEQTGSEPLPLILVLAGGIAPRWSCSGCSRAWAKRETVRCAQFWTGELLKRWKYFGFNGHTVYFLIGWFECEWLKICLAKLVKWRKKSCTWQRGSHILSSDPWPLVTRSCGYDPLAVSPHFVWHLFKQFALTRTQKVCIIDVKESF